MFSAKLTDPLADLPEAELVRLVRAANPLLAGRPLLTPGHRPTRGRPGQGVEFLHHQEYTLGDEPRNIDWRASARCRHPQVRRFRDERAADWFLCLDRSASMSTSNAGKWRLAVQLAAALSYLLLHLGNRVGLILFSDNVDNLFPLGRGHFQYAQIARALRESEPRSSGGGSKLRRCQRRLRPHNPVVVISDFLVPDGMRAGLAALLATGRTLHALQVVDAAEVNLHRSGTVALRDVESDARMTVGLAMDAASSATALAQLQTDVATYCRSQGIRFTTCRTEDSWKQAMLRHLKSMDSGGA